MLEKQQNVKTMILDVNSHMMNKTKIENLLNSNSINDAYEAIDYSFLDKVSRDDF